VTSDCYAILGVTPAAEDVVIGAAYRALMRHYHPDTNSDPDAQARAQEIAAAYAMLRDPEKRADYDARRGAQDWWPVVETNERKAPPMRTAGIATALLAVGLVGAVWLWPQSNLSVGRPQTRASTRQAQEAPAEPPVKPPPLAIAVLADPPVAPPAEPPAALDVTTASVPPVAEPAPVRTRVAAPSPPRTLRARTAQSPATPLKQQRSERVATLDRMSTGFFSQSMVNASDDKKQLLIAARDRSEAERKACKSDSCVADTYVRQIRETGEIMEQPSDAKK